MKKRILVVDDEDRLKRFLEILLHKEGYEVETACNGREAIGAFIECLEKEPFDLMLLDVMMPGIDGVEVLQIIRQEESYRNVAIGKGVSIIMLTALKKTWMESFKKGCDDYIMKPYKDEELLFKIEKILKEKSNI